MDDRTRRLLDRAASRGERTPDHDDEPMVLAWLASRGPGDPPGVNRYLTEIWRERVDLRETYPGLFLDPRQRAGFLEWARAFAHDECAAPTSLLPREPSEPSNSREPSHPAPLLLEPGVTVVGHFRSVLGIGAAARRVADLLDAAGERVHTRAYDHTDAPDVVPFDDRDNGGLDAPALDVVLLCVNGAQAPRLARALGPHALEGRYRIGLWFWELSTFPPEQAVGFEHVDEVWVTSEHVRDAVASKAPGRVRVEVLPLGTSLLALSHADVERVRAALGLRQGSRTVGFAFDHASRLARKNPLAVIDAYRKAVPTPDPARVQLCIKSVNAAAFPQQHRALELAAAGRNDIVIVDRVLDELDQQAFIAGLSVLVSLHRSEGYGLAMLEAMARGVPVVATGYSGNLAFMDVDDSWLIPYELVPVTGDSSDASDPYARVANTTWADPDTDDAAAAIAEVLAGGPDVAATIERARIDVAPLVSGRLSTHWLSERLRAIRAERTRPGR